MHKGITVYCYENIDKENQILRLEHFKRKGLRCFLYIIMNKLKKRKIKVLPDE